MTEIKQELSMELFEQFIDAVKFGNSTKVTESLENAELDINQTTEDAHTAFEVSLNPKSGQWRASFQPIPAIITALNTGS